MPTGDLIINDEIYDESKPYSGYKRLRNFWRKYKSTHVVNAILNYLGRDMEGINYLQSQPWMMLLLLKWVLIDDTYSDNRFRRDLDERSFNRMLQHLHDLTGLVRLPTQYENYRIFFRNIAYQQFLFQSKFDILGFTRQKLLFCSLPNTHRIRRRFKELSGIEISTFIELSFLLLANFIVHNKPLVEMSYFNSIRDSYDEITTETFMELISTDIQGLQNFLKNEVQSSPLKSNEIYEQTPLLKYPFLKIGAVYRSYDKNIFFRGIENYIYDYLRNDNASDFMNSFGPVFEKYVQNALEYSGVNFSTEKDLIEALGSEGKVVDFIFKDEDTVFLIDSKGVEMNSHGKVSHRPEILKHKTKDSAIKGTIQGFETVSRINQSDEDDLKEFQNKTYFLIIVTFKELYLGNGRVFYDIIGDDKFQNIVDDYGSPLISPSNIYFLSINSFDLIVEGIRAKKFSMKELFEKSVSQDDDPKTAKFDFSQHLSEWGTEHSLPKYISDSLDELTGTCKKLIKESST